jgi:hypothetical protein
MRKETKWKKRVGKWESREENPPLRLVNEGSRGRAHGKKKE